MRISHEAIYQALYVQGRGALYGVPFCTAIVGTCAIRARLRGRWAGFTLQPFPRLNYWCWDR